MSGFGLRALKKKQDTDEQSKVRSFHKHIVYGENVSAILTFQKLNASFPGEVVLITRNPYFSEEIAHDLKCSMYAIRSENVANKLMGMYPQLEIFKKNEDVFFYKDTKFHKFGGRAKSHDLRSEEEFFKNAYYHFKPENLIQLTDEQLQIAQLHKIIRKIELSTPKDLVEKVNFRLITGEEEYLDCENLYFCESPKKFFNLLDNKKDLPDSLAEFIAPLNNYRAITVYFQCKGEVYNPASSMIIPQSMTHEWGSFMLDFEDYDPATNTQNIKALSFIDEDDVQEEDLAKKIRHMQKVIERVIPEFATTEMTQTIKYSDEFYTDGINDEIGPSLNDFPVKFIGPAAPISGENTEEYQYLPRTLVALDSLNL